MADKYARLRGLIRAWRADADRYDKAAIQFSEASRMNPNNREEEIRNRTREHCYHDHATDLEQALEDLERQEA